MSWYTRFRITGLTLTSVNNRLSSLINSGSLPASLKLTSTYVPQEACVDVYLSSAEHEKDGLGPGLDEEGMLSLSRRIERLLGAEEFVFHSQHAPQGLPFSPSTESQAKLEEGKPPTLAQAVCDLLKQQNRTLATAESLTGGLLASALTDVPGTSAHFLGGIVAYTIRAKHSLGVPPSTIQQHGVVSPQTAGALATAVKNLFGTDIGVGVTGVAGPAEHGGKPVGTVWIGVDGPEGVGVVVEEGGEVCREREERDETKAAAVAAALNLLRRQLQKAQKGS